MSTVVPRDVDLSRTPFVLGVDLDNTLGDYQSALWRWLCAHRKAPRSVPPQLDDYESWAPWGLTTDEFIEVHTAAVNDGLYRDLRAYDHAVDALRSLNSDGVRIRVVTARFVAPGQHRQVAADTVAWLDGPANDAGSGEVPARRVPYDELMFTSAKHHVSCDAFVEDAPSHVLALRAAAPDRPVLVYDQPYNRHLDGPRATSWVGVEEWVRALRDNAAGTPL